VAWTKGSYNRVLMAVGEIALLVDRGDALGWTPAEAQRFEYALRRYQHIHRELREAIEDICARHGIPFTAEESPSNVIRGVDFRAGARDCQGRERGDS